MRIPSGSDDRFIYFVAVDATARKSRETGLTTFTVYRSTDGAAAVLWTTPTINEVSSGNMPGVYELTIDEGNTLDAAHDTEEMVLHITTSGGDAGKMAAVTRVIEIYRPKITEGKTLAVDSSGVADAQVKGIDAGQITSGAIATDAIGASEIASGAVTKIQAGLTTLTTADVNAQCDLAIETYGLDHLVSASVADEVVNDSIIAKLVSKDATADWSDFNNTTDSLEAIKDHAVGAKVNIDLILSDTGELQTDDVPGLIGALNNISTADVNAQCDLALADINLNHLMKDVVGNADDMTTEVADNTVLSNIMSSSSDTSSYLHSDDSLQAIRERGDSAWTTGGGGSAPTVSDIFDHFTHGDQLTAFKVHVATALADINLNHLLKDTADDTDVTNQSIIAQLAAISGNFSGYDKTTDSLQAASENASLIRTTMTNRVSQTEFRLAAGSSDNDAYNGCLAVITDATTAGQIGFARVSDYVGSTKAVTLSAAPGFTHADSDKVEIRLVGADKIETSAAADTALADIHLDHLLAIAYADEGHAESLFRDLTEDNSGTFRFTAAALAEAPSGTGASAATIADAVWDEATLGHTTGGTFGAQCATDIDAILEDTGTTLDGIVDDIKTAVVTNADGDDIADDIIAIKAETAAILLDTAVIGAAGAGLTEAGGTGDHLNAIPWTSAWATEVERECTDALNAYDPPTKGEMDSAHALLATVAKQDDISDNVDDIETAVGVAGAGLTDLGGMSTTMKGQILTEALKVLQATAMPEPGAGAPVTSPNLDDAIMYLYMALRNKLTVTSTFKTFHNSSDTPLYKKPLGDADSTFTESESTTI